MKTKCRANRTLPSSASRALGALLLLLGLPTGPAFADGGFFGSPGYPIWEHEQIAFVDWDDGTDTESLTLLPGFYGNAREFAWVVPVPAVPEVSPASRALFEDLVLMTATMYRRRHDSWDCQGTVAYDAYDPVDVDVIQHDLVGYYDVMVLAANDAAALDDTLTAWGFLHAGNSEVVTPLLDDYVQRGWVFVTMKVDSTAFDAVYPHYPGYDGYVHGGLEPLTLRFTVDAPVYPMLLSSASAAWHTMVAVFVCAEHRMDLPGATPIYANRIDETEWNALTPVYPRASARLSPGRFLTRLELTLDPEQMDRDLPLTRAATDTEFRELRYSSFPLFGVFVGTWSVAWAAGKLRAARRAHAKSLSGSGLVAAGRGAVVRDSKRA